MIIKLYCSKWLYSIYEWSNDRVKNRIKSKKSHWPDLPVTCGSCTFGKYMCLLPKCLGHRCHLGSRTVSISPLSEMPLEGCRKQCIMMPTCQCFAGQVVGDGKEKIVQNCWRCIVCLVFFRVFFLSLFSLCWRVALLPTRTCWLGDASTLFWQRCYCRQIFMLSF